MIIKITFYRKQYRFDAEYKIPAVTFSSAAFMEHTTSKHAKREFSGTYRLLSLYI